MDKKKTFSLAVILILTMVLLSGCNKPKEEIPVIPKNICENVICPDICKGEDLWAQKCVNGTCIDFVRIEPCSEKCGCVVDLCSNVKCLDKCRDEDLWSYKCVNGICSPDAIKEKCSAECGCSPKFFYKINPEGRYRINEIGVIANVYTLRSDQTIRAVVTCRSSICSSPPTVYYAIFEDYTERAPDELVDYTGTVWKNFKEMKGNELTIEEGGTYMIGVSTEYYIEVGFLEDS